VRTLKVANHPCQDHLPGGGDVTSGNVYHDGGPADGQLRIIDHSPGLQYSIADSALSKPLAWYVVTRQMRVVGRWDYPVAVFVGEAEIDAGAIHALVGE
jgi:hypothetical protein